MQQSEEPSVTIYDFIVPQKVEAFCTFYEPSDTELPPGEAFTDTKLRKFFGCMSAIKEVGDPLQAYVSMLGDRGFKTNQMSITGEWAIFVQPRISQTHDDLDEIFGPTPALPLKGREDDTETSEEYITI